MENRVPLTTNKVLKRIEELPTGSNLDLTNSGIVSAVSIQSETFYGNLVGIASTALALPNAANILSGTVDRARLSGLYDINISGTADYLTSAENILSGTISTQRLTGPYNIDVDYSKKSGISTNVIGGIASVTQLSVSGISTLGTIQISSGIITATTGIATYYGDGVNFVGIVTQIIPGIGVDIFGTQDPRGLGKGVVKIDAYRPIGKTIYVSQNGDDNNTGLAENHTKRTIKAAAAAALYGDTIQVFPGVYVEENPIILAKTVSVNGTELRNCVVTPKYPDQDLFYVNNGCHINNISFIGQNSTNGASIVALQPLKGTAADRFFDAARMIRMNLDFIANETVGYLTSTDYRNPAFSIGVSTQTKCLSDIKSILKAVCFDITRGGNSKCVGAGKTYYTDAGALQYIVGVKTETIDALNYAVGIARSCINNVTFTKPGGGNYRNHFTQVKDLAMQPDGAYGNQNLNSCANVVSAIYSCVGVVTTIINNGLSALGGAGINTTYPGNLGIGFTTTLGITSAVYDNTTGNTILKIPGLSVVPGDSIEIYGLKFSCSSGGSISTQTFPSGAYGNEFYVNKVNSDNSFTINTGVSTIAHNYVGGGWAVNRSIGITTVKYDNISGIATITATGAYVKVGNIVTLIGLGFTCPSGPGIVTYPSGKYGYNFPVTQVIGAGTTFVVNVGTSTLPHTYVGGGVVKPAYSKGVGPITQGPYIRNCTNFIPNSIGMKVDGFEAEPGDADDIGVTGTMSVDSYTQYNQGGIGVSITNGGYAQLVSIFTICDDIAIYTASGGQCDLTNSNSSFGNYGLYSNGVGDAGTKSIYRYTGKTVGTSAIEGDVVTVSGLGNYRPYDGQAIYFDTLYYTVQTIVVDNQGSGYSSNNPPRVDVEFPQGPSGIRAEASPNVIDGKVVSIDVIASGNQYLTPPAITIAPPPGPGIQATAHSTINPIYYNVESASLPVNGTSRIVLTSRLNNDIPDGSTVYFSRLSLQIATTISFEWVGAGTNINTAKPALGGIALKDNEVVKRNGGQVVFTSTNQAGNFRIGEGVTVNQLTGTISGRSFSQSLLNTVTPLIIALSK